MSLALCGKRSSSIFEELPLPNYQSAKRSRFGPHNPLLSQLRSLFPQMNQELLERALESSGNDLDSAIKSLTQLCLEAEQINLSSIAGSSDNGIPEGQEVGNNGSIGSVTEPVPSVNDGVPSSGSEWVELFVREMMNSSDVDDARARASRALEALEKSIVSNSSAKAQEENLMLKGQMEILARENSILKRAVAIQHERQKEQEGKIQELNPLKELVSQYQEKVRILEVTNYSLSVHLQQAQQNNSMPGHFHPDIF